MLWFASFTDKGVPATGLTPTIDVWQDDGTQVVTAQSMTEIDGGHYKYDHTTYSDTENYVARVDGGATLKDGDRYKLGSNTTQFGIDAAEDNIRGADSDDLKDLSDEIATRAAPGDAMDLVADAVDAAAVATDAIDADALATDAVNEIRDSILADSTPFNGANVDVAVSSREAESDAATRAAADLAAHGTTQSAIAALNDIDQTDVQAAMTAQGYTAARAPNLDNLDAAVSSRSSHDAADVDTQLSGTHGAGSWEGSPAADVADAVWDEARSGHVGAGSFGETVGTLHGKLPANAIADETLEQAAHAQTQVDIAALNDPSAADIDTQLSGTHGAGSWEGSPAADVADAVWDEALAGHLGAGSTGEALNAAATGAAPGAVADAVWDEARGDHVAGGSFGEALQETVASREAESDAATRAAADIAQHVVTQGLVASLNDIDQADVQAALTAQGYTAGRAGNLDSLDAAVSSRAVAGDQMALTSAERAQVVDDTWDEAIAGHLGGGSTGKALDDASAASGAPTPADIADAVWDEDVADHLGAGTTGAKLDATLDDIAAIVAAILAEAVDGTVSVQTVLTRVNSFARGKIALGDVSPTTKDAVYYEEDDTTVAFTNRKTINERTPQ